MGDARVMHAALGLLVVIVLVVGSVTVGTSAAGAQESPAQVTVRARGTSAGGEPARMVVRVNGVVASPVIVDVPNENYADYVFSVDNLTTEATIDVVFVNDAYSPPEDRNLFVESITVAGVTYPSTGDGVVIDRGSGAEAFDGIDTLPGQPVIWWNAAIRFPVSGPEPPPGGDVIVRAAGTGAQGEPARMVVRVNGVVASPAIVAVPNDRYTDFSFAADGVTPNAAVDVVFVNDAYSPPEDRNLLVDSITVAGRTRRSTGPDVILDRGSGQAAFDGIDTLPGQSTLYWNGALRFRPPIDQAEVSVRAKGYIADGIAPRMVVRVNGVVASPAAVDVGNESYRDFVFTSDAMTGDPIVEVAFVNDGGNADRDRNLFVDSIRVGEIWIQSRDDRVEVDRGSGEAAFDGIDTGPGQYALWWDGALRYRVIAVPEPPAPEPRPPLAGQVVYRQNFSSGELDTDVWNRYDARGNAGWGVRRPSAFSVIDDPAAEGGKTLRVTARMGDGEDEGLLVSGAMSLNRFAQTYGRYTIRVRTERDRDRVTTGVVLLWPDSLNWPEDGEIDWYEAWRDRFTRSPVELVTHYVIGGVHGAEEIALRKPDGTLVDGSEWHTYVLDWRPDYLAVSVDGGDPSIITSDPAKIPQWNMHMTVQLDAWEAPYRPGLQPVISQPVSMYVDWVQVERYPGLTRD